MAEYTSTLCPTHSLNVQRLSYLVEHHKDIGLSQEAEKRLQAAFERYEGIKNSGKTIYGESTGFGPFVSFGSGEEAGSRHAKHLLGHLGAGYGEDCPADVVRAAMILRLQALIQGHSGIRPEVVHAYLKLLRSDFVPSVPITGSVGASGDLIPMASIAGLLVGYGSANLAGKNIPAEQVQQQLGLDPNPLKNGRDALALVNCTSFSTAWTALAIARAHRLLDQAESATAVLMAQLGARQDSLDARLHQVHLHEGQVQSAKNIREKLQVLGAKEDSKRPLQEIYSVRCAPQLLGACRDQIDYAERIIETEMNGVDDNPLNFPADAEHPEAMVIHGGNFFAQHSAFAADALNAALTQAGLLAERQLDLMVSPAQNKQWPLILSWDEGAQSGLAGAQIGASALVAEMRMQCQHYATSSIPTNGGNQDIVPMAANAGRQAYLQTERLAQLLATLALAFNQLNALREAGKVAGAPIELPEDMPRFAPVKEDRPLREELAGASRNDRGTNVQ